MVREILKIRTDLGLDSNNPTFKGIELTEYNAKFPRMGMPSLTASLKWATPLDDEWTRREYVTLRGERFYIRHTPSGKKDNQDSRYSHEIEFTSEFAEILGNTYFVDAVPDTASGIVCQTRNKPCTNNTTFKFYGTISEFVDRLNCAFLYAKIADTKLKTKTSLTTLDPVVGDGYCAMLDPYGEGDIYDPNKSYEFSFEDKFIWEAITESYDITEIPFERRGRKIIFGALPKVVEHKFEYGHDNELLSVYHKNANAKVINRITMLGSSENIPYYYPNETEYGHISIATKPGNKVLTAGNVEIANMTQLLSRLNADSYAVLGKYSGVDEGAARAQITGYATAFEGGAFSSYIPDVNEYLKHLPSTDRSTNVLWHVRVYFKVTKAGTVVCRDIRGHVWKQNDTPPTDGVNMIENVRPESLTTANDTVLTGNIDKQEDRIILGRLDTGDYIFQFAINIPNRGGNDNPITSYCRLTSAIIGSPVSQKVGYYWQVGDKKYDGSGALGVKILGEISDEMIGDGFGWTAADRMPFQDHLIPPKYRSTLGAERFYNALNGTYTDPDTGNKYVFPNPYIEGAPSEHMHRNEEIKPTIEGVTNASGQLIGVIADIAYDANDNDVLKSDSEDSDKNDSLKYEHSFFYIKLNVFNGDYGFDLFAHVSQSDPMTIQMLDGSCNGCKFKIQALEYEDETGLKSYRNPVQTTGEEGSIVPGGYADKVKESWQEWQQDTLNHSIWICVQKDADTFGVLMPNQSNKFLPKIGDKFNIINIDLPQGYILAAEKRLEEDGIRFMADNNEEKFTFDIQASRIFFAENPQVLSELDEYSVIKVKYNGRTYEQYVNQLTIDCKDSEALPDIGIDLTDTLAVGQSFVDQVAERASSLIANPYTMGGASGGGGGLTTRLADLRYLKKTEADRSKGKIASDIGFEVGEFVSGASGGIFFRDPVTGQTYIEADKLKIRMKAIFEELEIAKVSTIGGKFIITPGGGLTISFVERILENAVVTGYRCYFKAKEDDKGAECRFVVGDQVQCHEFNVQNGTTQDASNRYYWRLVTAVNNEESYIELSKTDCDNAYDIPSDVPMAGDTIVQLGNRNDATRQSAIILSTVDAYAPCVTLYNGIDHYSLENKSVVEYGVDKSKNPPEPFFNCYGRMYIGPRTKESYLEFNPADKSLVFKGRISVLSSFGDDTIGDYIDNAAQDAADKAKLELQSKINELQNQIDGVVETWSSDADPANTNYPADGWDTESERQNHIGDVYFNIGAYDPDTNPNAGGAWRWYYNSTTDYGWVRIADSDAVRALQLAQMSVLDTDVLYIQTGSQTDAPTLPSVNTAGVITNFNGWTTTAPAWEDEKYIWQCTYVKKGDGSAAFAGPTCISGRNGVTPIITEQYYLSTSSTQLVGDEWHDSKPDWVAGCYYWTRSKIDYGDSVEYTDPICVTGDRGTSVLAEYSADGTNWHPAYLVGDEWMRTSSDGGSTWTAAIKIVGEDGQQGADGKWRKFQWATDSSATTPPENGWQDTPMTSLPGEYVWMRSGIVVPPATEPTTWEAATRVTGDRGADGTDVYSLDLSNEMMGVLCDAQGNVTGAYETSQASVWKGTHEVTDGITYSIAQTDGVSATISANGLVNVSALTKDNATIVVRAVVSGVTLQSTISVYKVKAGENGEPAVVYSIEPEVDNITVGLDGTLSTNTLKVWIYKTTGDDARVPTNEKTLKYQRIGEDASQLVAAIADAAVGASITVTAQTTAIILTLYDTDGTTILDRERVPLVTDGKEIADEWAKIDERLGELLVDLNGLDYLRRALRDGATVFEAGLLLSSLIKLGLWDTSDKEHPIMTKVYAGMNGIVIHNKPEDELTAAERLVNDRTIASWWGGDMVDRFDLQNQAISPVPDDAAAALVRMDGSAYFSRGNVGFNADGSGWLAGSNIIWDADGSMTFGSGIKISTTSGDKTLESLINFMVGLGNVFIPEDVNNQQVVWDSTALDHIRVTKGFCSNSFISARGLNPNAGGSSGGDGVTELRFLSDVLLSDPKNGEALVYNGTKWVNQAVSSGLDEEALLDFLTTNKYATKKWVGDEGYLKSTVADTKYLAIGGTAVAANRLAEARLLWGQPFNGTVNVTGNMIDVGNITTSAGEHSIDFAHTDEGTHGYLARWKDRFSISSTNQICIGVGAGVTGTFDGIRISAENNIGLGRLAEHKLDVNGTARATKIVIGSITLEEVDGALHINKGVYSDGFVSAKGRNSSEGGSFAYNRLDTWADYATSKEGWVLSAKLGWDLKTRIDNLPTSLSWANIENKPTTLAGYGITDAKISNGVITLGTSTIAPITQHQDISHLATKTQLADYVTLATPQTIRAKKTFTSDIVMGENHHIYGVDESYGSMLFFDGERTVVGSIGENTLWHTCIRSKGGTVYINDGSNNRLILTDSNYATVLDTAYLGITATAKAAEKLATPRTLWGQSFDGTGNVNGHLSIGSIFNQINAGRAELSIVSTGDLPCDIMLGRSGTRKWSITSRNSTASDRFDIYNYTYDSFTFSILENGNVGIGTTTPAYKLDVSGTLRASSVMIGNALLSWDSNNNALKIDHNVYSTGAVSAKGNSTTGYSSGSGDCGVRVVDTDASSSVNFAISDDNGKVIANFLSGHIVTKMFNSANAITTTNIASYLPSLTVSENPADNSFGISDESGNFVVKFRDGHIYTKLFDSSKALTPATVTAYLPPIDIADDLDTSAFSIGDESGNAVVKFAKGHIATKNFNSANVPEARDGGDEGEDFAITDSVGNAIVKFTKGHIATKNFNSAKISAGATRTIKILAVGNSYAQDAFSYVPFLLKKMCPDIEFAFGILYKGGGTLQDHYEGLSATPYQLHYINSSMDAWLSTAWNFSVLKGLQYDDWDIVTFQQQSSNSRDYATFQPYLNSLIDYIFTNGTKNYKVGWLMTPAYPTGYSGLGSDTSDSMFTKICTATQRVMNETPVEFVIPVGTAIQNCRSNTAFQSMGEFGWLSYEGLHLQEGLPCQIEAYVVCLKIFEMLGMCNVGIYGDKTIIDSSWTSGKGIPGPNGTPVASTLTTLRLGQQAAMSAVKRPYAITSV